MEEFEEYQKSIKKKINDFYSWIEKYGKSGLAKEYYQNTLTDESLREITPIMNDDGYFDLSLTKKVVVQRKLSRDPRKIICDGEICYGPFGLRLERDKSKFYLESNKENSKASILFYIEVFNIKIDDIIDISREDITKCYLSSLKYEEKDSTKRSNIENLKKSINILSELNETVNKNTIALFIATSLDKFFNGVEDDRSHLKNNIVTQQYFHINKLQEKSEKIKIINNFRKYLDEMHYNTYVNLGKRNNFDIICSVRKIIIGDGLSYHPMKVRTIHPSYKKYFCPFETSDGDMAGLSASLSCYTVISPGSQKHDEIIGALEKYFSEKGKYLLIINGLFISRIMYLSYKLLLKIVKEIEEFSSVYIENNRYHIDIYKGRIMRYNGEMFICPEMNQEDKIHPTFYLGFCASTIPFLNFNAAARGIFMSNMTKQILEKKQEEKNNMIIYEKTVDVYDEPLIKTLTTEFFKMPGFNANIRWEIYEGYNIEDGIVVTSNFINRIKDKGTRKHIFTMALEKGDQVIYLNNVNNDYENYKDNGLIKEGQKVSQGTILASKLSQKDNFYKKHFLTAAIDNEAIVEKSYIDNNEIIVIVYYKFTPEIGDKMVSNHGQKGVISYIVEQKNIEYDLIINPCCIPSRMTLGQIVEGIVSNKIIEHKLNSLYVPFTDDKFLDLFVKYISQLEGKNYNDIYEMIPNEGVWHCINRYFFLGQRVQEKIRASGINTEKHFITNQAVKGRKNEGGMRIGVMERDCLLAHGQLNLLNELITKHADGEVVDGIQTTTSFKNTKTLLMGLGLNAKIL